jgi:hypothetical protein
VPSNERSLALTDAYRRRLVALSDRAQDAARASWPSIENLDATDWPERTAALLTRTQAQGVRLTAGYLAAYLRSETGSATVPGIDSTRYAGVSRDGRKLADALLSPLIGVRVALKEGKTPSEALRLGLVRAERMVGFEAMQAARDALRDEIERNEQLVGSERNVSGTCAACMALSGTDVDEVHPGCQCINQPKVAGVVQRVALPTGAALFSALSKAEQDSTLGAEAAELVREGADLKDFVSHSKTDSDQPDWITQKPAQDV